jgi:hypothetical protein
MNFIKGKRVLIPEFYIVVEPTIRICDIRKRIFNIMDRYSAAADISDAELANLGLTREEAEEIFAGAEYFDFE